MNPTSRFASLILAAAAVAAIAPASAFAESGDGARTEFFWQPAAQRASARLDLGMTNSKFDSANIATKSSATSAVVTGQYAINETWAFGLMLGYQTLKNEPTGSASTNASGLQDIGLTAQSLRPMGAFTLAYGGRLYLSPANAKQGSSGSDGNSYSGGHSLAPYVGGSYEMAAGQFLGGSVEYRHRFEQKTESGASTFTANGGHATTASLFYQYKTDMFSVFPTIRYAMTDVVSNTGFAGTERRNAWDFGINGAYYATSDISVLASYARGMTGDFKQSGSDVKNYATDTFLVAGRFEF